MTRFGSGPQFKFLVGGLIILATVGYLIVSGFGSSGQFFLTVAELHKEPTLSGQNVRIGGVIVDDSIQYDAPALRLEFDIVDDIQDPTPTLHVVYVGPRPDLLEPAAQVIVEGIWGADGAYAPHLVLQPGKFYSAVRDIVASQPACGLDPSPCRPVAPATAESDVTGHAQGRKEMENLEFLAGAFALFWGLTFAYMF